MLWGLYNEHPRELLSDWHNPDGIDVYVAQPLDHADAVLFVVLAFDRGRALPQTQLDGARDGLLYRALPEVAIDSVVQEPLDYPIRVRDGVALRHGVRDCAEVRVRRRDGVPDGASVHDAGADRVYHCRGVRVGRVDGFQDCGLQVQGQDASDQAEG